MRCPRGSRRNKKTGECVYKYPNSGRKNSKKRNSALNAVQQLLQNGPKTKRCPNGSRKNKSGVCVSYKSNTPNHYKMSTPKLIAKTPKLLTREEVNDELQDFLHHTYLDDEESDIDEELLEKVKTGYNEKRVLDILMAQKYTTENKDNLYIDLSDWYINDSGPLDKALNKILGERRYNY